MKCILCNHSQAKEIHSRLAAQATYADLVQKFSLTAHEIHSHQQAHCTQAPLTTPQGRAAFPQATRQDQLFMTLAAARALLDAAIGTGHARQILPAARLFLHCQIHIERHIDPLTDERRLRNANARHKLLTAHDQINKKSREKELEMQGTVRLLEAHPELGEEWIGHIEACRRDQAA